MVEPADVGTVRRDAAPDLDARARWRVGASASGETKAADGSAPAESSQILPPVQTLDGYGTLKTPAPTAQPITSEQVQDLVPNVEHPPGYYGPAGSPRALNIVTPKTTLAPLPALPAAVERRGYESDTARPLKPGLMALALMLILADIVAVLLLQAGGLGC